MIDITDTLADAKAIAFVTGTGQDITAMVGNVVKMKDVMGNDDDCEASARDADAKGRVGDERSEADGMMGAMPLEAASRVDASRWREARS